MNVLPKTKVIAAQWSHQAWSETGGVGITVPQDALQELLDAYVTAQKALEENVRAVLSEGESGPMVDATATP